MYGCGCVCSCGTHICTVYILFVTYRMTSTNHICYAFCLIINALQPMESKSKSINTCIYSIQELRTHTHITRTKTASFISITKVPTNVFYDNV